MDINIYTKHLFKIFTVLQMVFTKPIGLVVAVPAVAIPLLSTTEQAAIFLAFLFIADFITGIGASWVEFKKATPLVPASGKRYLIQSAKLRLSAAKFVCYALGIISAYGVEVIFVVHTFNPSMITTEKYTLTTIIIGIFCGIEIYSIFFENIKRMGFDIIQKTKKLFTFYEKVKSKIE